ncbi:MAG TPA: bi-domain-containing oxidoreductase [Burkholderiales bacterium]|nr:bi-domain-containing oxidoreductase [Burkholderiales bacterium]
MKQVLQSLSDGTIELASVPCPQPQDGHLLIATRRSLISAGTERMLLQFGKANLLDKARQQPEKVRAVIDKARTDGMLSALTAVRAKLDQPLALGYCNVGSVIAVGRGVRGFEPGMRVVSNGRHAEVVSVPVNLCAVVPDPVEDDEAVFTVVGAIALQGIRLAQPTLGEAFAVMGLGLVGLVTVELLRAHGCRVLGLDYDADRLALARAAGAEVFDLSHGEDPLMAARRFSRGRGVDGVLVTASSTSSEPIHQAAAMCRKRGRIVLVGVTGLELSRTDFYEKELTFQVSCSYGPGRYDPVYEEKGQDYPVGFVRWTEQRNFEAVLDMLAQHRVRFSPLITHRMPLADAKRAYDLLIHDRSALGIVLQYSHDSASVEAAVREHVVPIAPFGPRRSGERPRVSVIGAGNYARQVLLPALRSAGTHLRAIVSSGGVTAVHAARRLGFEAAATDASVVMKDDETDAVVIATRHDTHVMLACSALDAGKDVFVEKPLAIDAEGLAQVEAVYRRRAAAGHNPRLMVGFNRRFAPHVTRMKSLLDSVRASKVVIMTINAGEIPREHWTQDREVGGGRIIGEACHFIDLARHLVGTPIVRSAATPMRSGYDDPEDTATITLDFADGSVAAVHYVANGHRSFPKEQIQVFCDGRVLALDNFRTLRAYGWPGFKRMSLWRQDKGNAACARAFADAVRSGSPSPIPFEELVEVTRVTLEVAASFSSSRT